MAECIASTSSRSGQVTCALFSFDRLKKIVELPVIDADLKCITNVAGESFDLQPDNIMLHLSCCIQVIDNYLKSTCNVCLCIIETNSKQWCSVSSYH